MAGEDEDDVVFEVPELSDDGTPVEKKAASEPLKPAEGEHDDEVDNYSEKVKKRIGDLTFKQRQAQRERDEAMALQKEAISFAEQTYRENEALKKRIGEGAKASSEEAKSRLTAELSLAKRAYKDAYEEGDSEKVAEASAKLGELASRLDRASAIDVSTPSQPAQPTQQRQQPRQQAQPKPSEKAMAWQSENQWFGKDSVMTGAAMAVHNEIVNSGVDPDTEEYYKGLNSRMRAEFPHKFAAPNEQDQRQRTGTVVAPVTRSANGSRKVTLTQSQVKLAKRLGITSEQYAAQIIKDQKGAE